ncbi:MAG: di-trans,poly-cis-decaprenylcistransferase [Planctomycetes bacterium]|nr:di-trans,poly-cis-decaprenylcistransferase [Planctomycetota bacterium]
MDGNGRWAQARGLPRVFGHVAGARAVRRCVRTAGALGLRTLTLFAFSSANWMRPAPEVDALCALMTRHLREEQARLRAAGVRLEVIGRRDRLPGELLEAIEEAERQTSTGTQLCLRLAIDYSSRESILGAARRFHVETARGGAPAGFGRLLATGAEDVDLLIRTGGEQRLSDFLLWECAWAELHFTRVAWPDFGARELRRALRSFAARERRFGALPEKGSAA